MMKKHVRKGTPIRFDDELQRVTYVMTTGATDRDDEEVNPRGGDFREFENNPAVMYNHDTDDFPVGTMRNPETGKMNVWNEDVTMPNGEVAKDALLGDVYFSKVNPKGRLAYGMVKEGTFNGASISFVPKNDRVERTPEGRTYYPEWKLLEFTVCPLGSNPQAIAMAHKRFKSLSRKKAMKTITRKFWVNKKLGYAWVLKSEGPVSDLERQYLEERGLTGVREEDEPPEKGEGYEEEKGEKASASDLERAWQSMGEDWAEEHGFSDVAVVNVTSGKYKPLSQQPRNVQQRFKESYEDAHAHGEEWRSLRKTEGVAEGVARRAKEIEGAGADGEDAVEAAMDEQEVPETSRKAMRSIVKRLRKKRWIVKTPKGYVKKGLQWAKKDDGDFEAQGEHAYLIYKPGGGGSTFVLQVDGKNERKGSLAVMQAAAEDFEKQKGFTEDKADALEHETAEQATEAAKDMEGATIEEALPEEAPGSRITQPGEQDERLTDWEEKTKDAMSDCVSTKVSVFKREHPDWDDDHAVAAAYGYCGEKALKHGVKKAVVAKLEPHVKRQVFKRLKGGATCARCALSVTGTAGQQAKALADSEPQPVGLKALKEWHDVITRGMEGLHESEHPHVISAGEKALKHIEAAASKAYDHDFGGTTEKHADDMEVEESDGQFCILDPDRGEYVEVDGKDSWDTREAAEAAMAKLTEPAKGKSLVTKTRRDKRLTKAHHKVVKAAVEFLDDAADAQDTPRRLAAGMKHHSKELSNITEGSADLTAAPDPTDAEALERAAEAFEKRAESLAKSFYSVSGERV